MKILKAGLFAGLIGGALDILAAFIIYGAVYGAKPVRILQSITAGLPGPAAYQGGTASAAFGLAIQFFIAFVAGLAVAMMRIDLSRRSTLATGAAFGVAMYFFMQMIVLPLSLAASSSPDMKGLAIGIAIHIFLFGLPMAFAARRVLRGS